MDHHCTQHMVSSISQTHTRPDDTWLCCVRISGADWSVDLIFRDSLDMYLQMVSFYWAVNSLSFTLDIKALRATFKDSYSFVFTGIALNLSYFIKFYSCKYFLKGFINQIQTTFCRQAVRNPFSCSLLSSSLTCFDFSSDCSGSFFLFFY